MSQTGDRTIVIFPVNWGHSYSARADVMIYYENRIPETDAPTEIAGTWIFAAIFVGLVMAGLGIFN